MGIPSRVSKRAQYSISQVKNIGNWPKNATFSLRKSPKYANFSLLSFLRNFASIFAKLISQNGFLHFAKFRETCHSTHDWLVLSQNSWQIHFVTSNSLLIHHHRKNTSFLFILRNLTRGLESERIFSLVFLKINYQIVV